MTEIRDSTYFQALIKNGTLKCPKVGKDLSHATPNEFGKAVFRIATLLQLLEARFISATPCYTTCKLIGSVKEAGRDPVYDHMKHLFDPTYLARSHAFQKLVENGATHLATVAIHILENMYNTNPFAGLANIAPAAATPVAASSFSYKNHKDADGDTEMKDN